MNLFATVPLGVLSILASAVALAGLVYFLAMRSQRQELQGLIRKRQAELASIGSRYSVEVVDGAIVSSGANGFRQTLRWDELEELCSEHRTVDGERLLGWVFRGANSECFVPDAAEGEKQLRLLILSLPDYHDQESIWREANQNSVTSLWRKVDPHPKRDRSHDFDDWE